MVSKRTFEEDWKAFCEAYEYDPDHVSEETFEYFREQWIKQRKKDSGLSIRSW